MIDTIIFDFGDIFINLNKQATIDGLQSLGFTDQDAPHVTLLNEQFETGSISKEEFIRGLQTLVPTADRTAILTAWTAVLLDFPKESLQFIQELSKKYRLFLLSNTDAIHIATFEERNGTEFYTAFYNCFEKVYFSFDMGLRKPNPAIYQQLLDNHNLVPCKTLFVDDKQENTDAAYALGIQVWNLQVGKEDVVSLYAKNKL
jgi:putative hydrolase of the HAD superfamily